MVFNFSVKTRVTVTITRTDVSSEHQIYQETFSSSSGSISATRNVSLPAGNYRIDERYHIEAAPDIMPTFVVFSADPQLSWNAIGAGAGNYTLSINASWHDVSATVSGDLTTNPSPIQVSGTLGSSINNITIICPNGLDPNDPINATVHFTGLLDKNTQLTSGATGPIITDPLAIVDTVYPHHGNQGANDMKVQTTGNVQTTNQGSFTVVNPPIVTSVSPNIGNQGASNLSLQITGANFVDGAIVEFSGTGITINSVTYNSPTSITANIDISTSASQGSRDVKVTNPGVGTSPAVGTNLFQVVGPPTITAVTPSRASRGAYITHLTISGTNFLGTPIISFSGSGITIASINSISQTTLDINLQISPSAPEGARDLTVTNAGRVSATLNNAFTVLGDISVTGVNPDKLNRNATSVDLTIIGSNFMNGATVSFSGTGITINSVTCNSPTNLTVNVDVSSSASLGLRDVTVTNPYGVSGTGSDLLAVLGPVQVTDISPNVGSVGASGLPITITGDNFITGAGVTIVDNMGNPVATVTVASPVVSCSHTINAFINVAPAAIPGAYGVKVTNVGGSSDILVNGLTVLPPTTVTGISPQTGSQGAANMDVQITGMNFVPGAMVSFNGGGITVNSASVDLTLQRIYANISIDPSAGLTARNVTVTNPGGVSTTLPSAFTVIGPPTVISISPSSANIGVTGFNVTVLGSNFTSQSQISFGAGVNVLSTVFVNSARMDVTISIDSTAALGLRDVTVTNPGNVVGVGSNLFTVLEGLSVTSVYPDRANRGATLSVSIFGRGFNPSITTSDVNFGSGITVNSVGYVSENELLANISIGGTAALGLRDLSVAVDGVTSRGKGLFEVLGAPVVISATPAQGSRGATMMSVVIGGSNFVDGASVELGGGIAVHSATVNSSSRITALISISPSAALGTRNVTVTNPGGVSNVGSNLFQVIDLPSITPPLLPNSGSSGASATADSAFTVLRAVPEVLSANPSAGSKGATLDVQIMGNHFESGAAVSFSGAGITVNSVAFVDSNTLLVNITIASNASSGLRNVTVTNPDGQSDTGIGIFSVGSDLTISSVSPTSASPGSKLDVTIAGTGFLSGITISFGAGITTNSVTYISSRRIRVNITISPTAVQGARDVTVANPGGVSATLSGGFTVTGSATLDVQDLNGSSTIYASVGDTIDLRLYLNTTENINGIAAYLTYDMSVLQIVMRRGSSPRTTAPFEQGSFLGGTVLDNDRHGDPGNGISGGQLDYVEVNTSSSTTGSGTVATFQLNVIGTPSTGYTTIAFDFDRLNGRVTALSVAGDGTLTPATTDATIYITSSPLPGPTTLSGKVELQSRTDHSAQLTIEIRSSGSTTPLQTRTVTTAFDGSYTLNLTVPAGTYDIAAKMDGFLRQTLRNVAIPATEVNLLLLAGDVNGDNTVDLVDFGLLAASFGSVEGDSSYNPSCDFSGDGVVDLSDFAYLSSNFLHSGDPAPGLVGGRLKLSSRDKVGGIIEITLEGEVSSLYAYALQVEFEPNELEMEGVELGDLLSDERVLYHLKVERPGLVTVLVSLVGESLGISGEGDLLRLRFRVLGEGGGIKVLNGSLIAVSGMKGGILNRIPDMSLDIEAIPTGTFLGQNFPNPFNPETWIPFSLAERAEVKIQIYDLSGRLVRTLKLGELDPGLYCRRGRAAYWDGRNQLGERVANGVYLYCLTAGDFSAMRRMVILK
jgi:hypothetical protein